VPGSVNPRTVRGFKFREIILIRARWLGRAEEVLGIFDIVHPALATGTDPMVVKIVRNSGDGVGWNSKPGLGGICGEIVHCVVEGDDNAIVKELPFGLIYEVKVSGALAYLRIIAVGFMSRVHVFGDKHELRDLFLRVVLTARFERAISRVDTVNLLGKVLVFGWKIFETVIEICRKLGLGIIIAVVDWIETITYEVTESRSKRVWSVKAIRTSRD